MIAFGPREGLDPLTPGPATAAPSPTEIPTHGCAACGCSDLDPACGPCPCHPGSQNGDTP